MSDLRIELRLFRTGPSVFGETRYKGQLVPTTQGTPANVCRNRWLILIFNMSKTWRSMLGGMSGEEHLLLRKYFPRGDCIDTAICTYSLPLLAALIRRGPTPHIYPFVQ